MLYQLLRPILFKIDSENAKNYIMKALNGAHKLHLTKYLLGKRLRRPTKVMGLDFSNPVGLAAGFDASGDNIDVLGSLGFGFIELGTVTPKAQYGNPKPRIFRHTYESSIINQIGYANLGVDYLVRNIEKSQYNGIIGVNIGKNSTTPQEYILTDLLYCLRRLYQHVDYISVNFEKDMLPIADNLLEKLKTVQMRMFDQHHRYVPIVIKFSPSIYGSPLLQILDKLVQYKYDGVSAINYATNTKGQSVSGEPIKQAAEQILIQMYEFLKGDLPIISSGGILDAKDASSRFRKGADLVQVYTGLVYQGPKIVRNIVKSVKKQSLAE